MSGCLFCFKCHLRCLFWDYGLPSLGGSGELNVMVTVFRHDSSRASAEVADCPGVLVEVDYAEALNLMVYLILCVL